MITLIPIVPASPEDQYDALAEQLAPRLREALESAGPGHRLRVTTLPEAVMERLAEALSDPRWTVCVLNEAPTAPFEATAATIIRLRDHSLVPVLVFFPPGPRTASEDSLDIATFTELSLASMAQDLSEVLMERLAGPLRADVREVLKYLSEMKQIRHADEQVDYLLTVLKNGGTPEAAGAAIFEFGLVPDFALFTRGASSLLTWVSRNREKCEKLFDLSQPLQKRLRSLGLKPGTLEQPLFHFFRLRHTEEPRTWGRQIACDSDARHLSFDLWEFADAESEGELRIILDSLNLPKQQADEVSGADRMSVLNVSGRDPLKIAFRSVPNPAQVPAWKSWRVQILAIGEAGTATVAWESNNYPKPAGGRLAKVRRSIKVKELEDLDEGTYFLRVDAYDAAGALLTTPRRIDPKDDTSRAENESEPFLLVKDEVVIDDPDVRATFVPSLLAAWLRGALKALDGKSRETVPELRSLTGTWNQPIGASVKGDVHFDLDTDGFHGFAVVVPGLLRRIEVTFLENPHAFGVYQMALGQARSPGDLELVRKEQADFDGLPAAEAFMAARAEVFGGIRDQHLPPGAMPEDRAARTGVVEVVDLTQHADAIHRYARAFEELVHTAMEAEAAEQQRLLRGLAWLDAVEIRWPAQPGDPGRAILVGPTHPLRLLWHLQHSLECKSAIDAWDQRTHEAPDWRQFIEQLRDQLLPLNLPMAVFDRRGRAYTEAMPVTPHWGLYLPDRDAEGRHVDAAARERALSTMGIRTQSVTSTSISSLDVAVRLLEFIVQHPYVDQLRLNVFNPGNGSLIAETLRMLEVIRRQAKSLSLRYAVRLFAPASQLDTVGEAVEGLLDPDRQVGEDDEFTLDSGNHLHPKLLVARNDLAEFVADHTKFPAHVSILIEQFTALGRVGPLSQYRRGSFVRGLVQEPDTVPMEAAGPTGRAGTGWSKGVRPSGPSTANPTERLVGDTLAAVQRLQASIALGQSVERHVGPVLALQLDAGSQGLLRQVHDVSDRVITIDRHLGVDFFDSPSASDEVGYLLDFSPEFLQEDRQRIVLTTRNTHEIEALLAPMLRDYGIHLRRGDEVMVLEGLRSLSGRLALRLEGSVTRAKEVVGLLFARWLLEEIGALENRIVLPLDAHQSWFSGPGSQRRADLLLVGFPGNGVVRMDVIEVKLRDELSPAARGPLYRSMNEQTDIAQSRLKALFDPDHFALPRADFLLRSKELAGALSFYIRRAVRYGLLPPTEGDTALAVAERLDEGYRLEMDGMGIVFERLGSGHHIDEDEPGFTVHRFGANKARKLFHAAMGRFDDRSSVRDDVASRSSERSARGMVTLVEAPGEEESLNTLRTSLAVTRSARGSYADTIRDTRGPSEVRETSPDYGVSGDATPSRPEAGVVASVAAVQGVAKELEREAGQGLSEVVAPSPDGNVIPEAEPPKTDGAPATPDRPTLHADVLLGSTQMTPQFGVLGRSGSQSVAIDLTGCNTISLFGVQGFGKSYTLGVIAEMASLQNEGVNVLPSPLATVLFHFHKSDAYEPEYVTAVEPNRKTSEVDRLLAEYGAKPAGLKDVLLLAPEAKVEARRREYPGVAVEPIKFSSAELGAESWKFLLGAYGNDALYVRQLVAIMRRHRQGLTLDTFRQEIANAQLPTASQRLAEDRLALAEPYIDDARQLGRLLRPGRTVIVDLRDEWIEKDEALGLFVVMLRIFAASRFEGKEFNKLVVFDEAHKYISESDLISQVVETIREMRHQATSVIIASQDPLSVPRAIIELTSVLILHRMTSPQWLKHLRGAIVSLNDVQDAAVTSLSPGEALVWAQRSTDKRFTLRPQKVGIRPRFTQHGGGTKTAVDGATIR